MFNHKKFKIQKKKKTNKENTTLSNLKILIDAEIGGVRLILLVSLRRWNQMWMKFGHHSTPIIQIFDFLFYLRKLRLDLHIFLLVQFCLSLTFTSILFLTLSVSFIGWLSPFLFSANFRLQQEIFVTIFGQYLIRFTFLFLLIEKFTNTKCQ